MNKMINIVVASLLLSGSVYAENTKDSTPLTPEKTSPAPSIATGEKSQDTLSAPSTSTVSEVTTPPTSTEMTTQITTPTLPTPTGPIDCTYKLSATTPITEAELALWAQHAAVKLFDYSFDTLDQKLENLKSCFTDQGWLGFNDALQQSGNLSAIKLQQLTVSSQVAGKSEINTLKPNQWKITIPLEVVYQNTQEKLTQSLAVVLVITKKTDTQLGIVQLIAAPKTKEQQPSTATS